MDNDCEISVVAPVYNGAAYLVELVDRLRAALSTCAVSFEVVLVDDGSADTTWSIIEKAARADGRIKGVKLSRNFGQHPAITAGLKHTSGAWVVVMDSDLQDRPEDIPKLYQAALAGAGDIVIATRSQQDISLGKRLSSVLFNAALSWLGGIQVSQRVGNFRILSRTVANAVLQYKEQFRLFPALMARVGFRVAYLEVSREARAAGRSSYTFRKLVRLAVDAILANSEKPLWLGIYLGACVSVVAIGLAAWAVYRKLAYEIVFEGWSSLMVAIAFFSGVQLMFSGLIGIYVGRIFNETKHRPLYIVDRTENVPPKAF